MRFLALACAAAICITLPANAASCIAKLKTGKAPYPHIPENKTTTFWSYSVGTLGTHPQYGIVKSLVGDRQMMIPVRDLYDLSPGCNSLPEYRG